MENKWNIGQGSDLPIGFGLSLAANERSMEAFAARQSHHSGRLPCVRGAVSEAD